MVQKVKQLVENFYLVRILIFLLELDRILSYFTVTRGIQIYENSKLRY